MAWLRLPLRKSASFPSSVHARFARRPTPHSCTPSWSMWSCIPPRMWGIAYASRGAALRGERARIRAVSIIVIIELSARGWACICAPSKTMRFRSSSLPQPSALGLRGTASTPLCNTEVEEFSPSFALSQTSLCNSGSSPIAPVFRGPVQPTTRLLNSVAKEEAMYAWDTPINTTWTLPFFCSVFSVLFFLMKSPAGVAVWS